MNVNFIEKRKNNKMMDEKLLIKLAIPNFQEKMKEYIDKGYWEE